MKSPVMRGLLLTVAALAVLAVAAIPAHATVTPVSTAVRGTSSNSVLTDEGTGIRTRCPLSTFTGSTSADGRSVSGSLTFTSSGGVTCTESLFGSSVTVTCRGNVTLRSTASTAGTSASGTVQLDSGFECTIRPVLASARSIRGLQTPTNCTFSFSQAAQTLTTSCATIAVDGGGESGFSATYAVSPRLTIS